MYCRGDYHQLNPQRIQETPILCCCCLVERDSNVLIMDENRPRLTEGNENKLNEFKSPSPIENIMQLAYNFSFSYCLSHLIHAHETPVCFGLLVKQVSAEFI